MLLIVKKRNEWYVNIFTILGTFLINLEVGRKERNVFHLIRSFSLSAMIINVK